MKIVVAPDSFKGSLSALQAAEAIANGVRRVFPDAHIVQTPLADGGEGTVDALVTATQGRFVNVEVTGPLRTPVTAPFGFLGGDTDTAVVEMAAAAGLLLVPAQQRDPRYTTTYGVGELLSAAVMRGAQRIIVGLGGSATNDGGAGAMEALGVRFLDQSGSLLDLRFGAIALARLGHIDMTQMAFPRRSVPCVIASDVTAPLLGPTGASAVFGPQKGADAAMVAQLEDALQQYATVIERDLGVRIADLPGAGAAGGLGAGLIAFLGAEMKSGIDLVLEAIDFASKIDGADLLITGEGKIDAQTLQGKTIYGVLAHCQRQHVPAIAFGGIVDQSAIPLLVASGMKSATAISPETMSVAESMSKASSLLEDSVARTLAGMFNPALI